MFVKFAEVDQEDLILHVLKGVEKMFRCNFRFLQGGIEVEGFFESLSSLIRKLNPSHYLQCFLYMPGL